MNFLGHCLFSDDTPAALAGSLWPDFARRPAEGTCSASFFSHFDRHQYIDRLTDNSEILLPVREQLRPVFRKTTPVIIDMMLDHHIAIHWRNYHSLPLEQFSNAAYAKIAAFDELPAPERLQRTLSSMMQYDWFVGYRSRKGIHNALLGVARRVRFQNPIEQNAPLAIDWTYDFESTLDQYIDMLRSHI
ncbi:acyl carrier protein phosphodiesterase [Reinekea marinisedimentorum]|uniref:Acyl carrier protein phosphodiesterase n=1 Tax=Reinekea marinisedimentorum TaxID=230495 RepID=A0A4V2UJ10_9GAMM|nr:acyl carrier protein phosphodiesterase [Reinekea marinisedimentorum]TCS38230.1 acyl carrier protein phosphodiesterase [Reinekea marinisedimentorum]